MLIRPLSCGFRGKPRARQQGVVLVIALIVLVAMMLTGIALVRSVDTTNIVAGNLAFQQAATHSGDTGVEGAIACLAGLTSAQLQINQSSCGYIAAGAAGVPGAGVSWDSYWGSALDSSSQTVTTSNAGNLDNAGNLVKYVIHRLCTNTGAPTRSACASPPTYDTTSGKQGPPILNPVLLIQYRITARIAGPRSTVSYVQAIVTM
jgi:Tfp pilus assembly protein PilX